MSGILNQPPWANIRYPEKSTADDDVSIENKNEAEDKFDLKSLSEFRCDFQENSFLLFFYFVLFWQKRGFYTALFTLFLK